MIRIIAGFVFLFVFNFVINSGCTPNPVVSKEQALQIAYEDAIKAYGKKSMDEEIKRVYEIDIVLKADGWHVDYNFKKGLHLNGGGPHFVIDSKTGGIKHKECWQ